MADYDLLDDYFYSLTDEDFENRYTTMCDTYCMYMCIHKMFYVEITWIYTGTGTAFSFSQMPLFSQMEYTWLAW